MCEYNEKSLTRKRASPEHDGKLILDFPAFRTVSHKFLLFISYLVETFCHGSLNGVRQPSLEDSLVISIKYRYIYSFGSWHFGEFVPHFMYTCARNMRWAIHYMVVGHWKLKVVNKQAICLNKLRYLHTMEYYAIMKKNEVALFILWRVSRYSV